MIATTHGSGGFKYVGGYQSPNNWYHQTQAKAAIDYLEKQMIDWIPVTTRVPEDCQSVLLWLGDEGYKLWDTGWYDGRDWYDSRDEDCYPTHWLSIEAPKLQQSTNASDSSVEAYELPAAWEKSEYYQGYECTNDEGYIGLYVTFGGYSLHFNGVYHSFIPERDLLQAIAAVERIVATEYPNSTND